MPPELTDAAAPAPASGEALSSAPAAAVTPAASDPSPLAPDIPKAEQADNALSAELAKIWDKHNPKQDPLTGKFAPKEGEQPNPEITDPNAAKPAGEVNAEGQPVDPTKVSADQKPEESKLEPAKPVIEAPHSWSAAEKAKWASVPPELQTYIARRETEAHQAITRTGEQLKAFEQQVKSFEPLDQLLKANKDDFAKRSVQPAQAIAVLLDAQRQLDANPLAGLVQIGRTYGIDLVPLLQAHGVPQQNFAQPRTDPKVAQLEATVREQAERLSTFETKVTERDKAEQQSQEAEATKVITDFAKDKPHFEEVKQDMALFLSNGRAKDLNEAYDMATHANPTIRARIQEDQRKADEDKRKADEQAKAEAARKANSVNVKSDSASRQSPKSMDDTLNEIARRHYG